MPAYRHSKSGLFLMEIILAILFFSVAGVICVQLFAKAHLLGQASRNQTMAVSYGQSVAECFKAADGSLKEIQTLLGGELADNTLTLFYNRGWNTVTEPQPDGFILTLSTVSATLPFLQEVELRVSSTGVQQPLLLLPVACYSGQ